jgi:hypothetical protein
LENSRKSPQFGTEKLARLRQHRLAGFDLSDGLIYPFYGGRSILNIPSSLCDWLGAPRLGAEPLADDILSVLGGSLRKVILILMDGLGYQRLTKWMEQGKAPVWVDLARQGLLAPITSICPSTTSAALTSLWTGRSATEHGITGYEMWMKEYGVVANTILHMPITFQSDLGALERAGFEPEKFIPFATLGAHLQAHGIKTYGLQHHSISHSSLSRMLLRDVEARAFSTAADLWVNLRLLLEEKPAERQFIWVYWGEMDHFGHFYGPEDERTAAEFALFSRAMQELFLERAPSELLQDSLLILTADHGLVSTPVDEYYDLRRHPNLLRRLHIQPTGEHRLTYLYIQPGQVEAVREYIERQWPNQFHMVESAYAIEHGLLGPGKAHARLSERTGDYTAMARGRAFFWWADKENRMLGRHGGLSEDEMLVPFLAARL